LTYIKLLYSINYVWLTMFI